jgi:hypothetical protein
VAALTDVVNEVAIASPGGALTMIHTFAHYSRPYAGAKIILPRITMVLTYYGIPRNGRYCFGIASNTPHDVDMFSCTVALIDIKNEGLAANACYRDNFAHGKISQPVNPWLGCRK